MKPPSQFLTTATACLLLGACGHRTVGGSDIQMMRSVFSAFDSYSPSYYKGRKNGHDYFMMYVSGRKLNLKCPVETSFIEKPIEFSSRKEKWRTFDNTGVNFTDPPIISVE